MGKDSNRETFWEFLWDLYVTAFRRTPITLIVTIAVLTGIIWGIVHYFHYIAGILVHPIRNLLILVGIVIAIILWKILYWPNLFRALSRPFQGKGGSTNPREIFLTILAIVGISLAALSLLYDFSAATNALCFLGIAISFFIGEVMFNPSKTSASSLISYDVSFNARLRNRGTATVSLTFQWPERNDSPSVRQRIRLRASAAIAERFSRLSQAPSYRSLRQDVWRAIRRDAQSLGLSRVHIFIHDIEVKGGQDAAASGIVIGGS